MKHAELVTALAKPGKDIHLQLTPDMCHAVHMLLGLAGEVGELIDSIKKQAIYNKPIDRENLVEELGDLEFYLEGLRQVFSIKRDDVLAHNIAKLTKRYGTIYSDTAAQARVDKK